jgi:hypothetical protein
VFWAPADDNQGAEAAHLIGVIHIGVDPVEDDVVEVGRLAIELAGASHAVTYVDDVVACNAGKAPLTAPSDGFCSSTKGSAAFKASGALKRGRQLTGQQRRCDTKGQGKAQEPLLW